MALLVVVLLVAVVFGVVGIVVKGLFWLLLVGVLIAVAALVFRGAKARR